MWSAFAATLEGNWEHVMMHGLLPALMLLLYAADWRALWRIACETEHQKTAGQNSQPGSSFRPGQAL